MTKRTANNEEGNWRNLCWDEENRLMGVTDFYERNPVKTSAYVYNAGGERIWKFSGDVQQMTINGSQLINVANITDKTLYSSPYLVANDNNYTKHYFIESERVCSKIGGGFSNSIDPVNEAIIEPINSDQPTISEDFTQHIINSISCTNIESPELNVDPVLRGIEDFINIDENEDLQYFFITDHLGSSSFITDVGGDAVQHLQYMPFGEHFVNQTSTSWETPYKFSGKEKDDETGYSYFGARYYDSDLSVWLSVDPLASKYPSMSAYMYVAGNPVMLVDPDGRKIRPGNSEAKKPVKIALENIFHGSKIGEQFYQKDGDSYTSKDKNLTYRQFKKKFKNAVQLQDAQYTERGNGRDIFGNKIKSKRHKTKLSKDDIKAAYNAYKKLDSENEYEIIVVSDNSTRMSSFFKNVTQNNETTVQYHSNDFDELATRFDQIEDKYKFNDNFIAGSEAYVNAIQSEKQSFLNNYIPDHLLVFPSGNAIIDRSNLSDSRTISLTKNAIVR